MACHKVGSPRRLRVHRRTAHGTWDYDYDEEGNLTEKEDDVADLRWEYGYDHHNRLVWVEKIDTSTSDVLMRADYKYDPYGNRIEKAVDADGDGAGGTDTTRYSYDGFKTNGFSYVGNANWDIWADLDGDNLNAIEMRYIRGDGIDQLFARHDDVGTVAWYLTDRLGSVRDMTDNSGVVKNTIAYDGFGNVTSETDPNFGDRYKWTGRELDVETGLQYNRARYYDSELGRWTSKDPLGFGAGDSNLYRYVTNRTTSATDPSGLDLQEVRGVQIPGRPPGTYYQNKVFLYYDHAGQWTTAPNSYVRKVGIYDKDSGYVIRGNRKAKYRYVDWAGNQQNWDTWFRANGSEIKAGGIDPNTPAKTTSPDWDPDWNNNRKMVSSLVRGMLASVLVSTTIGIITGPATTRLAIGINTRYGVVAANPSITIRKFYHYAVDRAIDRSVSPKAILCTIRQPVLVLSQWSGQRYLFLSRHAAVVVTRSGMIKTVWARSDFDRGASTLLQAALLAK